MRGGCSSKRHERKAWAAPPASAYRRADIAPLAGVSPRQTGRSRPLETALVVAGRPERRPPLFGSVISVTQRQRQPPRRQAADRPLAAAPAVPWRPAWRRWRRTCSCRRRRKCSGRPHRGFDGAAGRRRGRRRRRAASGRDKDRPRRRPRRTASVRDRRPASGGRPVHSGGSRRAIPAISGRVGGRRTGACRCGRPSGAIRSCNWRRRPYRRRPAGRAGAGRRAVPRRRKRRRRRGAGCRAGGGRHARSSRRRG